MSGGRSLSRSQHCSCLPLDEADAVGWEVNAAAFARARNWNGRDTSALLMELRVDAGRAKIVEDDQTFESRYTCNTSTPVWTESAHVSGGGLLGVTVRNNMNMPHSRRSFMTTSITPKARLQVEL